MSLAAVRLGATKCAPAETSLLVAANPAQTSNSTASINFAFCLIHPSCTATMNAFRSRRAFLQSFCTRLSGQAETGTPALGAYPRLSLKGCQRIQNVHTQRLQTAADSKIVSMENILRDTSSAPRFLPQCGSHSAGVTPNAKASAPASSVTPPWPRRQSYPRGTSCKGSESYTRQSSRA